MLFKKVLYKNVAYKYGCDHSCENGCENGCELADRFWAAGLCVRSPSGPVSTDDHPPDQDDALEAALDAISAGDWLALTNPLLRKVREAWDLWEAQEAREAREAREVLPRTSGAPETFMAGLAELYPELDVDDVQEQLARCIFVAGLWGRLNDD